LADQIIAQSQTGDGQVMQDAAGGYYVLIDGKRQQQYDQWPPRERMKLPMIATTKWGWELAEPRGTKG
jgi:hypothetical protein